MANSQKNIIFHIDGDAFFASCEQSTNLSLRGQAIAIGKERGVATAFSYEAKSMGVTRGMSGKEIKKQFGKSVQLISSDYRKYSLFSKRMKNIVRSHTLQIEGSSIDECYADLTKLVSSWSEASELAHAIQQEMQIKLGLTVSIGIGPTKTIAKIASGLNKPSGVTLINQDNIQSILHPLSLGKVSGIGWQSEPRMNAMGMYTIRDFVDKEPVWVAENLHKPYQELHQELRGFSVKAFEYNPEVAKSISKIRAFAPATSDRDIILSEFARNAEIVTAKLNRLGLVARSFSCGVKIPMQGRRSTKVGLGGESFSSASDIIMRIEKHLDEILLDGEQYRATWVALHGLHAPSSQTTLFATDNSRISRANDIQNLLDTMQGAGAMSTAQSVAARDRGGVAGAGQGTVSGGTPLISSRDGRKVLTLPYLGEFT